MTFKEKLKKEHPDAIQPWARGGCVGCPSTYGFEEKDRSRCPQTPDCWDKERCTACWNREIPGAKCAGLRAKIHIIDELHGVPNLTENAKAKINEKIYLGPTVFEDTVIDKTFATVQEELSNAYVYKLLKVIYKQCLNAVYGKPKTHIPDIKKVIFNDPATIVIWADGEKTVVKCQNGEAYDPEKGLAMAITKRALGNKGNYFDEIKKWTSKCEPKEYPEWPKHANRLLKERGVLTMDDVDKLRKGLGVDT